jgi:O-antigen/teichoic acid export membrane protein
MISVLLGPATLGLYVIAVTLTSATSLVGSSIAIVALPQVAGLADARQRAVAARRMVVLAAGAATLVAVPLALVAPLLIRLFFGTSFERAGNVCRVLLIAGVLLATSRALAATLTALGRPLDAGIPELVGLAMTAVALAALLPLFGLMGAAVASLLAYGASLAWMLRRGARALDLPLRSLLVPPPMTAVAGGDA